jgi:hypothetical protein
MDTLPDQTPPQADADDLILTPEQEKKMLDLWNATPAHPPGLKELTKAVFGGEFDGRSREGRALKVALSKHSLKAKSTSYEARPYTLSEVEKNFIVSNAKTMNSLEIARVLFHKERITNLDVETRAVSKYLKELDSKVIFSPGAEDEVPMGEYKAPITIEGALKRVNQYLSYETDYRKLLPQQRKNLETLMSYMHTFRFLRQMNNYAALSERQLCEDAFVRYTFDKPDLTQEELDQYIVLCNEVVMSFKIQARSERLQIMMEDITAVSADERMKLSMNLVEAIGKANTEYNSCITRQQKLLDDLKEKRSSRMSKAVKDNASVLNLIGLWKNEETRKQMLEIAAKEQKKVADEVEKLSNVSQVKARIMGLTKDEILFG